MTTQTDRTILAAVDFGEASARAVEVAGALARHWPATLRLLHAENPEAPVYFTHEQLEALAAQRQQLQAQAVAFLESFGRQHTAQPFTPVVTPQSPTDAILEHASSADLTVMGTHGRRGPSRWWLGSVAERVLREIESPLLVVHARDDVSALFSRVCVCAEAPQAGDRALALAEDLARLHAGTVTDRREVTAPSEAAEAASLIVVGIPPPDTHMAWSPFRLSCIRKASGAMLFVPERDESGIGS
jgi:nucleotide-binding universal stress UspA family protein